MERLWMVGALALVVGTAAQAQQGQTAFTLSQRGSCPMIHCTPEGTGLMTATLPLRVGAQAPVVRWSANVDANLRQRPGFQGCSADGSQFVCLLRDGAPNGIGVYTLPPAVNGVPAMPASFSPTESFRPSSTDLDSSGANPEVALIGDDGSILVADRLHVTRLRPKGDGTAERVWQVPSPVTTAARVSVASINPIDYVDAGVRKLAMVVTYSDGQLFALDPASQKLIGKPLQLAAPASPPITRGSSLYYVAAPALGTTAYIERRDLLGGDWSAAIAHRDYNGTTGASPLLYRDSGGRSQIVLHVPNGDAGCGAGTLSGDHLVGLDAASLACLYSTPLKAGIQVSPALDPVKGGVWFYQYGAPVNGTTLEHLDENGSIVAADTVALGSLLSSAGISNPRFIGHLYSVMPARDRTGTANVAPPVYVVGTIGANSGKGQKHALAICVARCPTGETTPSLAWVVPVTGFTSNDSLGTAYGAALPLVSLYTGPGLPSTPGIVIAGGQYSGVNATGNILVLGEATP